MRFEKWQALGNDYIIVESSNLTFELTAPRIERICESHFGAGSDGILLIEPAVDADLIANVRIFNPDGSEAGLSGNGIREAVLYLRRSGHTNLDQFAVGTAAGVVRPRIVSDTVCEVAMGRASVVSKDYPDGPPDGRGLITVGFTELEFQHVSVGNPQCAIEVPGSIDDLRALNLGRIGPLLANDKRFVNRTNVSFWQRKSDHVVVARIFERGVGETLASGTGATGAAVAARLRGMTGPVSVELDGGELFVEIDADLNIKLSGWAKPVYSGELTTEFIKEMESI